MDIYTLIHNDHEAAKALMKQIHSLPDERHQERFMIYRQMKMDVIAHNEAEEDSFYEALQQHNMTKSSAKHSEHEHHEANALMEKLDDRNMVPAEWRHYFDKLSEMLEHHINEEEGRVFTEARKILTQESAERLADIMQRLKFMKKQFMKKAS